MAHDLEKFFGPDYPCLQLKDKFGNDLYFGNAGDVWFPAFGGIKDWRQHLEDIRHIKLRPDDVILAGYPKTGTHWNQEIIYMLINGNDTHLKSIGGGEFLDMLSEMPEPKDKPRVFFTHLRYKHLPLEEIRAKGAKLVYLTRNPKDTWVSLYNHYHGMKSRIGYNGTWEHCFEVMMDMGFSYGDWFDYVLDWEQELAKTDIPIFESNFEELKKDPLGQIEKLDKFLGCNRSRELYEKIAAACKFEVLKKAKDEWIPEEMKKRFWKDGSAGLFRKGLPGDWVNWFTVAQNERFDELYARRMSKSQLTYSYQ